MHDTSSWCAANYLEDSLALLAAQAGFKLYLGFMIFRI